MWEENQNGRKEKILWRNGALWKSKPRNEQTLSETYGTSTYEAFASESQRHFIKERKPYLVARRNATVWERVKRPWKYEPIV
jgi:hypothetical protein